MGQHDPIIIRVEEADRLFTVSFRLGKSLPLLASASGRLFAAFMPRSTIEPLLQAEVINNRKLRGERLIRSMAEAEKLLSDVRSRGLSRIAGDITPGINALAAPVFDIRGYPATTISAVGPSASFDHSWNGVVANALRQKDIGAIETARLWAALTGQQVGCQIHPENRRRPHAGPGRRSAYVNFRDIRFVA